jgi:hypothetical protein
MEQGSEQAYKAEYDSFMSVPDEDVTYCNMPLDVAAAEGAQLAIVAMEDRQKLLGSGLDPKHVDTLKSKVGAFTYAAAKYELVVNVDPEVAKAWKESSPVGYELQKYLLRFYGFAFRNDKDLMKSVAKIKEGRGNKDMILDLLSAHILGKENLGLLDKIAMFDKSKIDEAKNLHDKLSELYARSTIDPQEVKEAKRILDRAYTYYKQSADLVKEHGRFVFEGTDRYQSYVSEYRSEIGKTGGQIQQSTPEAS